MTDAAAAVRIREPRGRWILFATILGSGIVFLDGTVVNVALPRLGEDLGASMAGLQWVLNAYTLTLAALILLGGSLGDRLGRRRIFVVGVVWFSVASLLCGLAPNTALLIVASGLQGVGGALLAPGIAGDHPGLLRAGGPGQGDRGLVRFRRGDRGVGPAARRRGWSMR